jgi:mono/diheme cytochrome c family protein
VQTNCIKCHVAVEGLEGAETVGRGEKLFIDLGCHGCHLSEGYEDLSKDHGTSTVGPSLRRIGAKAEPAWLVRWITNPHEYRPRTRMPNFLFEKYESQKDFPSRSRPTCSRRRRRRATSGSRGTARSRCRPIRSSPRRAAQLMDSLGCRGCHALAPDEVAGQLGANKDIAPNLSRSPRRPTRAGSSTGSRARADYSHVARMPSLRLSDDEATAITAYLVTLGQAGPGRRRAQGAPRRSGERRGGREARPQVRLPRLPRHPGMESESRIGAELSSFGGKQHEELFFGDRTDLTEDWETWTFHKLKEPRGYETKWIEQVMPQFDLADEDIKAIRVFLKGRTDAKVPGELQAASRGGRGSPARAAARRPLQLHGLPHHRGPRRQHPAPLREPAHDGAAEPPQAKGKKVQSPWLFRFLQHPTPIRPWLQVRMPTFGSQRRGDRDAAPLLRRDRPQGTCRTRSSTARRSTRR